MTKPVVPQPIDRPILARFYVAKTEHFPGTQVNAHLNAVSRGDQNKQWAAATPVGEIKLTINNPAASELLDEWRKAGVDVEVTMRPVPVLKPDDGHAFRQADDGMESSWYSQPGRCGECAGMKDEHVAA